MKVEREGLEEEEEDDVGGEGEVKEGERAKERKKRSGSEISRGIADKSPLDGQITTSLITINTSLAKFLCVWRALMPAYTRRALLPPSPPQPTTPRPPATPISPRLRCTTAAPPRPPLALFPFRTSLTPGPLLGPALLACLKSDSRGPNRRFLACAYALLPLRD
jgi:hypothetical protein